MRDGTDAVDPQFGDGLSQAAVDPVYEAVRRETRPARLSFEKFYFFFSNLYLGGRS